MSRKNKQKLNRPLVLDTGGLDLHVNEPVIDVTASIGSAPGPTTFEVDVRPVTPEGLSLGKLPDISQIAFVGKGLPLYTALEQSHFLHMAARPTEKAGFVVVSNGLRFWTATLDGVVPALVEGVSYNQDTERTRMDWRPVVGSEAGLRVA